MSYEGSRIRYWRKQESRILYQKGHLRGGRLIQEGIEIRGR